MSMLRRAAVALLFTLTACTGANTQVTPDPAQPPAEAEPTDALPQIAPQGLNAAPSEREQATFDALCRGLEERATPRPQTLDPLLTRAALLLASHQRSAGAALGLDELRAALEVAGAFDAFVHMEVISVDNADTELPLSDDVLAEFLDISAERTANAFGVAWAPASTGSGGAMVLLSALRVVELEPTPRRADAEGRVRLKGRILEKDAELSLVTATGDAATSARTPISARADGRFSVDLQLPAGIQTLDAELVGVGASWGRSFAQLRFHRDPPPTHLDDALKLRVGRSAANAAEAEDLLRERINQRRSLLGLNPLLNDPGLRALALQDAQARALDQPHPRGAETAEARLKNFGVLGSEPRYLTASDNDPNKLTESVWLDPGLRKRLLDPNTTHLGLAFTDNPPQASRRHTLVAYAVKAPSPFQPEAELQALLDAINLLRNKAGAAPLTLEPDATLLLNRHAYPIFARGKPGAKLATQLLAELRQSGLPFTGFVIDIQAGPNAEQLKPNKLLLDPALTHIAIAVARGPLGKNGDDTLVAIFAGLR